MVAPRDAAFRTPRIHAFLLGTRLTPMSPEGRLEVLRNEAPWRDAHPDELLHVRMRQVADRRERAAPHLGARRDDLEGRIDDLDLGMDVVHLVEEKRLDEKAVLSERIDVHLFGAVIDRSDLEHATTIAAERSCAKRSRAVAVADAAAQHAV